MSRQAEEAHDRWFDAHLKECERDLVIGAKVYRASPYSDRGVEAGAVVRVGTGSFNDHGNFDEVHQTCDIRKGRQQYVCYVAKFGNDHEIQVYQNTFFVDRRDAHRAAARKIRSRIEDMQRDIVKLEAQFLEHDTKAEDRKLEWRL